MQRQGVRGELPFGLADVTASHAIAVGLVDWSPHRVTFIVKIALQQDAAGHLALSPLAPRLGIDTFDEGGNLLFATDFAPYKPACDVFVVEEADGRGDSGRIALDPLDLQVDRGETLGPRESTFDGGDPSSARDAWTQPSFDFASFQSSPKTRRIPWPRTGFDIHLDRGDMRFHAKFAEPFPKASVVAADGARLVARPVLVLDTIAIDARAAEVLLCFRALLEDAAGALAGCTLRIDLESAAGQPLADAAVRSVVPKRAGDTTTTHGSGTVIDDSTTTTAAGVRISVEETVIAPMARPAARSLPFTNAAGPLFPEDPPRPGITLDALRAQVSQPVRPAWEAMEGTVALRRSPAADIPYEPEALTTVPTSTRAPAPAAISEPRHATPAAGVALPLSMSSLAAEPKEPELPTPVMPRAPATPAPVVAAPVVHAPMAPAPVVPAPIVPAPVVVAAVSPAPIVEEPSTTTDDAPAGPLAAASAADTALLATIQREVWKGERALPEILAEHGLTEATWRALKQPARRA